MKMFLQELGLEGIDWIDLAHEKDRWRAILNAVIEL
jgi:hypothetical protein